MDIKGVGSRKVEENKWRTLYITEIRPHLHTKKGLGIPLDPILISKGAEYPIVFDQLREKPNFLWNDVLLARAEVTGKCFTPTVITANPNLIFILENS